MFETMDNVGSRWASLYFLTYLVIVCFMVINLLMAVMYSVYMHHERQKHAEAKNHKSRRLSLVREEADADAPPGKACASRPSPGEAGANTDKAEVSEDDEPNAHKREDEDEGQEGEKRKRVVMRSRSVKGVDKAMRVRKSDWRKVFNAIKSGDTPGKRQELLLQDLHRSNIFNEADRTKLLESFRGLPAAGADAEGKDSPLPAERQQRRRSVVQFAEHRQVAPKSAPEEQCVTWRLGGQACAVVETHKGPVRWALDDSGNELSVQHDQPP